jgi:hypothetical protein
MMGVKMCRNVSCNIHTGVLRPELAWRIAVRLDLRELVSL